jgi:hypothetical protein
MRFYELLKYRPANFKVSVKYNAIVLVAVLAGCSTLEAGSDYDKQANFAAYHTYAIVQTPALPAPAGLPSSLPSGLSETLRLPNPPALPNPAVAGVAGVTNPLIVQRVQDAIQQELTKKGYQQVANPSMADFTVQYTIGAQDRIAIDSYRNGPGSWGGGVDAHQYREGSLAINIFDARTNRAVWHGWANKEVGKEMEQSSEQPIREAIAAAFAKFPASK